MASPSPDTQPEPHVRHLPRLGRTYTALNATLMLSALFCGGVLFFRAASRDAVFYACLVGLVVAVAGCFILDRVLIKSIACPTCGDRLPRAKPPPGKLISIQYHCPRCQTLWDTEPPPKSVPIRYSDPL